MSAGFEKADASSEIDEMPAEIDLQAARVRHERNQKLRTSGIVSGKAAEASVISTAPDRDTSFVNYAQFLVPIAMIVQGQLKPFPPEKK